MSEEIKTTSTPTTAVVPANTQMVMPVVSAQDAVKNWEEYRDLMTRILDPKTDVKVIRDEEFKKKSYWRKLATFFNLSIETREEHKEMIGRTMAWHFTVRATAPNGRYVDGIGSCDVYEKATLRDGQYVNYNSYKKTSEPATPNSIHNVRSTAYTRAYNRAVSDLVGGGEVSAEEVDQQQSYHEEERYTPRSDGQQTNTLTGEIVSAAPQAASAPKPAPQPATTRPASQPTRQVTATPACPQCGGAMWDNREGKRNPKAPDFKCKDKECDGAIWLSDSHPKEAVATRTAVQESAVIDEDLRQTFPGAVEVEQGETPEPDWDNVNPEDVAAYYAKKEGI